jgi:uncharacterized repeat protein (TIGR01451 family)
MPTRPPGTPTLDLTTLDSFGTIDDIVFETAQVQPAGTGTFNTFEQIQHNGFEQGYNTDGTKQFDTKSSAVFNHSVLLAQVPIVIGDGTNGTQDGVAYREFLLDLNEPNGGTKSFLSLDSLQIWQEESGGLTGFTPGAGFAGAHTNNLVYNLDAGGDNWVGLNAGLSRGSGQADIAILVPDSLFINDGTDRFVYLYSAFGAQAGWDTGGGFEEWGTSTPNGPNTPTNAMSISKTASVPGGTVDHVGEVITYTIEVNDVGNTQLTGVTVTDPSVADMTRGADIVGNNDNVLDPGEIWSFTAHHTATAAEVNVGTEGGVIVNTATATSAQTGPVSATASVIVAPPGPDTIVTITPTVADGTADAAGEVINYAIALTNNGTLDLTEPLVRDLNTGELAAGVESGGFNVGDTNQDGVLNPGESWQFVDSYTLTQTDLDNPDGGGVPTVDPNLAHTLTVLGLFDQGDPVVATATTTIVQNPHVALSKTASLGDGGAAADNAGDVINYAIGLANDGNMDLTNPVVTDPSVNVLAAVTAGGFNVGDTNDDGMLSVGETWQYVADHTVTQVEIDNGGVVDPTLAITNTASASTDQGASATATASVSIAQHPSLTLVKAGTFNDANGDGFAEPGETIGYTFTEQNTGNMTLHHVTVTDAGVSVSGSPIGTLAPGATDTTTFTGSYTIIQADIDAGFKDNTAAATGDNASSAPATAHVVLPQNVHMSLTDTAATQGGGAPAEGGSLVYTFELTNDGNVTLHDPTVADPATGGVTVEMSGPNIVGDTNHDLLFNPGETWTFTGTRTLSADDITNGVTDNSIASALGPQNQPASAMASYTFHT